ncbi:transposase IS891/IS1136/IS1341 family [mine drainage metagenome]|uniref:Transposase IS891/IS1136/IS1341 family n=1 Tax=mine drainage metagenome TaxID=410659 RepID=T1BCM0_9ZZZZ
MELTRAYKFRIYPDAAREEEIDERLILAQQFYNKILEKSIASYQNGKTKVSMAQFNRFVKEIIQEDKKFLKLYSQTRCEIEFRLLKAYQNFFRRIKEGNKKAGFPRFRSRDRYKSITYPQDNGSFSMKKGRLRVSRIGTMPIDLHRKIEGTIKTLAIKREGKRLLCSFHYDKRNQNSRSEEHQSSRNRLGLDHSLQCQTGQR